MHSDKYSSEDDEEDWDFEDEDADDSEQACSLFEDLQLPSIEAVLAHDIRVHGFNFRDFRKKMGLDEIETIMCINFIRSRTPPAAALPLLTDPATAAARPWKRDEFMRPVLDDDAFLLHDWEDDDVVMADAPGEGEAAGGSGRQGGVASPHSEEVEALRRENQVLRSAVQCLAEYVPDEVRTELLGHLEEAALQEGMSSMRMGEPSTSGREDPQPLVVQKRGRGLRRSDAAAADEKYFDSYSHFGIHREMLSDRVRTDAYRDALELNPSLLTGARVLDVGCGTGILSMSAARGGASQVIGVDGSDVIASCAARICQANALHSSQGGPVTILAGRVEELEELPVEQVDVIVSEWMGYTLFFETMLDSVIYARDRWLKPRGAVLPDRANLYIAGAGVGALGTSFWQDVYGFSMAPVAEDIRAGVRGKALVSEVSEADMLTRPMAIRGFDLATMGVEDTDFSTAFQLPAQEAGVGAEVCAMVVWFDVEFSQRFCKQHPVVLTTSPFSRQTHWAQTVLPLKEPVQLSGTPLEGRISIARSKVHRSLDISLEHHGDDGPVATSYSISMS